MSDRNDFPDVEEEHWIAPAPAAAKLGVGTKTLAKLANEGKLRARRLPSGHRRYSEQSVDALAESLEEQAS